MAAGNCRRLRIAWRRGDVRRATEIWNGGLGIWGAIALASGVAALLNAAHPEVAYPRSPESVLADVNATLAGTRDQMLSLAATLDADNNRGCPLR